MNKDNIDPNIKPVASGLEKEQIESAECRTCLGQNSSSYSLNKGILTDARQLRRAPFCDCISCCIIIAYSFDENPIAFFSF